MDNNNNDNNNDNIDFIDEISLFFKKHLGKMGIVLGALGAISSAFVSLGYPIVAGVALALTNCGIFIGGLAYERLSAENIKLNDDISEHKEMLRKMTIIPNTFYFPESSAKNSKDSLATTDTHYDTPLHIGDLLNKQIVCPNAINICNSPDAT